MDVPSQHICAMHQHFHCFFTHAYFYVTEKQHGPRVYLVKRWIREYCDENGNLFCPTNFMIPPPLFSEKLVLISGAFFILALLKDWLKNKTKHTLEFAQQFIQGGGE